MSAAAAEPEVPYGGLPERSIPPLPAIDTSPESWRFVASAFVVECLLWGQVFSSGIFLKYLATRPVSSPCFVCAAGTGAEDILTAFAVAFLRRVGNQNLPYRFAIPAVWL
jgi:hypothetical protein